MKVATIVARVLLGLIFVVFGSNIFLHFIPMPPLPATLAGDFSKALMQSHYIYVVGLLQVIGGLLLLIGLYVPLGLTLLIPVIANIKARLKRLRRFSAPPRKRYFAAYCRRRSP